MYILGISSTTKILSVALVEDTELLAEFSVTGERAKAENITLLVERTLTKAKLDIKKVDAIAVTKGPGSYGGIRGGVTSAKSFAQALKVPVVGISTLEAMAYNYIGSNATVLVVLDAKRDEFNVALFAAQAGTLKRLTDDFVITKAKLDEKIEKIEGEIIIAKKYPRAANVAMLAKDKVKDAGLEGFLKLLPQYSHQPNIRRYNK